MHEIWVFEVIRESGRSEYYYFPPGDVPRERIEAIRSWDELLSLAGHRSPYPPAGEIVATRTETELRAAEDIITALKTARGYLAKGRTTKHADRRSELALKAEEILHEAIGHLEAR